MIKMTLTSGPFAGQTRTSPGALASVDPVGLLTSCVQNGWIWEIDYSQATQEEAILWGRADLAMRCFRALQAGLPVMFEGRTFRGLDQIGELEDIIVDSGRLVTIERDDDAGVVIGTSGWEH